MANTPPIPDRRVQRTREVLRHTLVSLLAERSWDDINIRDLCEHANIGRSTFYLHFRNKEELLVAALDGLRAWLNAQAGAAQTATNPLPFVRGLIEHAYEQRTLFRAIIGRRSGHVVQKRFQEMITRLVGESKTIPGSGWQREATISYIAGALVQLLAWWVNGGTQQSAHEIEELFFSLTRPMLHRPPA